MILAAFVEIHLIIILVLLLVLLLLMMMMMVVVVMTMVVMMMMVVVMMTMVVMMMVVIVMMTMMVAVMIVMMIFELFLDRLDRGPLPQPDQGVHPLHRRDQGSLVVVVVVSLELSNCRRLPFAVIVQLQITMSLPVNGCRSLLLQVFLKFNFFIGRKAENYCLV